VYQQKTKEIHPDVYKKIGRGALGQKRERFALSHKKRGEIQLRSSVARMIRRRRTGSDKGDMSEDSLGGGKYGLACLKKGGKDKTQGLCFSSSFQDIQGV